MDEKANKLEDRLIDFAVRVITVVEALPDTKAGKHIANQLVRAGTAPAPNYGEARADFVHKLKVSLKELRETFIWLKIIERKPILPKGRLGDIVKECDELISIFVTSLKTASTSQIKNQKS